MLTCYAGEEPSELKVAEEEARRAQEDAEQKTAKAKQLEAETKKARELTLSQEDLNRILADERRKHDSKFRSLEANYEKLIADNKLDIGMRTKLEADLADLQKAHRTEQQQKEYEVRQLQNKAERDLAQMREEKGLWEAKYKDEKITRALQDAAIAADAFNARQIVDLLKPMARMSDLDAAGQATGTLTPVIDFADVDETTGLAKDELSRYTPEQAVQRMKQLSQLYGNLFKANVASGIGTGSATGGIQPGPSGQVDVRKLSAEQFRKLYKENPAALGLKPRN